MLGRLTSLTNTDSQIFLLLRLNHENGQLSSIYRQQVSQATHSNPTHYFLPAAVPLSTKPIISTNKLNSFQARSLVNAAVLALLPWFPN